MEILTQTPEFQQFFNNYYIFRCLSSLPFQRALNDLRIFVQTEIMSNLVFLAENAKIWKFAPNMEIWPQTPEF